MLSPKTAPQKAARKTEPSAKSPVAANPPDVIINKDDGTGEAHAFAERVGIPVLAAVPQHEDIRRKSANYQIIGHPDGEWGPLFQELADNLCDAPPVQPAPLTQDDLIALFDQRDGTTDGGFR